MRHVDKRYADFIVQIVEVDEEIRAELCIERGKRFVEQEHFRLIYQRTRNRNPLLLPAGKLIRFFMNMLIELNEMNIMLHFFVDRFFRHFPQAQRKRDVFVYRKMRKKRVGLENRIRMALIRRKRGDVRFIEQHCAFIGIFETCDDAQKRRLAAA